MNKILFIIILTLAMLLSGCSTIEIWDNSSKDYTYFGGARHDIYMMYTLPTKARKEGVALYQAYPYYLFDLPFSTALDTVAFPFYGIGQVWEYATQAEKD